MVLDNVTVAMLYLFTHILVRFLIRTFRNRGISPIFFNRFNLLRNELVPMNV
jgi:hypothetical protein